LVEGRRGDQVSDGLGLRQIDSPVPKSPQCEFARLSKPRPGRQSPLDGESQNRRRPVARYLDHILGRIAVRRLEKSNNDSIDCSAFFVD
jgi:hypothetical protein